MTTTAATKKTKKATPRKVVPQAKKAVKSAAKDVAKDVTHKGRNLAGILSAVLVPVATVAIGYGLSRYYGINLPTKVMSLMR